MASNLTSSIKEAFNTTPRAIRWMLLIAAFVVVLILLFLLTNKDRNRTEFNIPENHDVELIVSPTDVSFLDTEIGGKAEQNFQIRATFDAIIDSVTMQDKIPGVSLDVGRCDKNFKVSKSISCSIKVTFAPIKTDISGDIVLSITWHNAEEAALVNPQEKNIVIPLSVKSVAIRPEPVPEPEPIPEPVPAPDKDETVIGGDINVFDDPGLDLDPELEPKPLKPAPKPRVEKCSDFAMPGYSTSGVHIGWIKPKNGRYEFHPFADVNCDTPTGVYDPDTGIITSIDGKGKKIGTDADHVGYAKDINSVPQLGVRPTRTSSAAPDSTELKTSMGNLKKSFKGSDSSKLNFKTKDADLSLKGSAQEGEAVYSSRPYDRTFILRQFKPIPATIVSDVRADPSVYCQGSNDEKECNYGTGIPVRATVDRNVYSDNGRTIIIPTGTLLMGYLTGELPGPYKAIGRMQIKWYQFIRPDGVEFNFANGNQDPYSADSQGRVGVPGYGSTDYIEQMVMPLLTAMIPAAVNMIAPIADTFVNQIDLDNNTVVQSGKVRSSELAKNEVITAWNKVAQKLMVDALDNTVPPFSIAAGTRITVYSPVDLIVTCGDPSTGKKCAISAYNKDEHRRKWSEVKNASELKIDYNDASWKGQVRSFNMEQFCTEEFDSKTGKRTIKNNASIVEDIQKQGYDYRTVLAYCESLSYEAVNNAKWDTYYQNKLSTGIQGVDKDGKTVNLSNDEKAYNEQVLGLKYAKDEDGKKTDVLLNPFGSTSSNSKSSVGSLDCDGQAPDQYGCCPGEVYTDMGEQGFNCCPTDGGDCFPPFDVN